MGTKETNWRPSPSLPFGERSRGHYGFKNFRGFHCCVDWEANTFWIPKRALLLFHLIFFSLTLKSSWFSSSDCFKEDLPIPSRMKIKCHAHLWIKWKILKDQLTPPTPTTTTTPPQRNFYFPSAISLSHLISAVTNSAEMQNGMCAEPKPALASGSPGQLQSRRVTAAAAVVFWHLLTTYVTQNLNTCLWAT